ncbi:FAD-binding and (Fe-S)-binding domain-containing protein [Streptomyces daghestanicus]|uniref:D-lactate dehydrogenase (cytochrome) n=1 Tax=Streptomyces daghestanicus TaxID=66885 RepID=A0ABQ3Q3Z5_9ACTN|nr:FAD-binding and (Fe-S)-binding domain-containing protein [Streptomyces daghestanicus]GGU69848.1 oxidoreductase [Streptomyces daghestanicus]GHI32000.1 oxidoreductase [Streptomyces daghestanicus]
MPLLDPKPAALRPHPVDGPAVDRVPDERAFGTPDALRDALVATLGPGKVLHKISDLVRYASDASPYRLVPRVVVVAETTTDVSTVLRHAREHGRHVVFRAAGTSLNGQAQGDDILVDVRRHWTGLEMLDDKVRARIGPGTTIGRANISLSRHGRLMGPDPASSLACTVGGVVANNASGMTAGTTRNSYRLLSSLTVVLPSGTIVDTAAPDAEERLRAAEPDLVATLLELKAEIEADSALAARIRTKYELKNTSGYRLDAFLDGATAVEILRGLMVGSQGTLGFIAETVFDTVPLDRLTCTALLFFPDLPSAAAAVPLFNDAGARAVELMDGNTLRACAAVEGVPDDWRDIPQENAALLVEFRASTPEDHLANQRAARAVAEGLHLVAPVPSVTDAFVTDPGTVHTYWHAREAFMTAVGKARPTGTTLITEDFAVPPSRLAEASEALLEMQRRYGYDAAVAGHAAHGNLHFLLAFNAARPEEVERYAAFMDEFCAMVVDRFDGSLKAEHATGRNMTPYLEAEWGTRATELMWRVKQALDPHGVLAPGVVLNRDPKAHLKHLKTIPTIEAIADPCIECGFCEPVCPSRDLTTTPRQRIVLRREMMRQESDSPVTDHLLDSYGYDAVDTCAGDSSCKIACPVGIDTGAMMKHFRHQRHGRRAERNAERIAERFAAVETSVRAALGVAEHVDDRLLHGVTSLARKAVSPDLMPEWISAIPGPAGKRLPHTRREGAAAVYFVACVNRIFAGPEGGEDLSLPEAVVALSERAGRPVWVPSDLTGSCCATIWHSKGYDDGNAFMANRTVERAWEWTDGGTLPLVVDASSCALGIGHEIVPYLTPENKLRHERLKVVDSLVWAAEELLPRLVAVTTVGSAVIHPTCSMHHLGDVAQLESLARFVADRVTVPVYAECCGFAGDRGMLHRELTESATAHEAEEVVAGQYDAYLSANRTCEIGMEHVTGRPYQSVLLLLERVTRPA